MIATFFSTLLGSILARTILSGGALFQGLFALSIPGGTSIRPVAVGEGSESQAYRHFRTLIDFPQRTVSAQSHDAKSDLGARCICGDPPERNRRCIEIDAVVLESNGDVSVIPRDMSGAAS